MEDELGALGHSLLVDPVGEDLIEKVGLEFLELIARPDGYFGVNAVDVFLLGFWFGFCLEGLFGDLPAFDFEDVVVHISFV